MANCNQLTSLPFKGLTETIALPRHISKTTCKNTTQYLCPAYENINRTCWYPGRQRLFKLDKSAVNIFVGGDRRQSVVAIIVFVVFLIVVAVSTAILTAKCSVSFLLDFGEASTRNSSITQQNRTASHCAQCCNRCPKNNS